MWKERTLILKWIRCRSLIGLLLIAMIWFSVLPQGEAISRNIGLDVLGYDADISVSAPYSSLTLEFPVPRLAKIQSATAAISLTPNAQLSAETIFFFYFNDKLVETRTVKELRQRKTFTINLPLEREYQETLRLQIKSNMFISDDLCRDYYSGGLFFIVHKDSRINLNYDMLPVRTVDDFFGSFQQSLLVVAPNEATLDEYTPAAWTYGLLKKTYPHLNIQFVRAAELASLPPVPRIWVGVDTKLPTYFKSAVAGITLVDPNTLLISAPNVDKLKQFVQQLADLPVFSLNPTNAKRIAVTPVENPAGKPIEEAISFGSANVQEGILVVPAFYRIFPALLDKIPERLGLHIEGSHSVPFSVARPARLDILVNNSWVHSSSLDQTGMFKRDFLLPDSVELRAQNNLSIQFHYPDEQGQCLIRGKMQYAQVFPTSYAWGAGAYRPSQFSWANIGLFFGRKGVVLLDQKLGANSYKVAGEIAYFLNRQLPPGKSAFPEYQALGQQSDFPGFSYMIVAGMTDSVPTSLQDNMPISLGKNFTLFRKTTQTTLFEYQPQVNSVVGRIGDYKGAPLVILTANLDGGMLADALKFVGAEKNYDSLTGNVMVFHQPQRIYSFDVRDRTVRIEKKSTQTAVWTEWGHNGTWLFIALGILVVLLIVLIVLRRRRMRKISENPALRTDQYSTPFK